MLLEKVCLGDMIGSKKHSCMLIVPWLNVNDAQTGGGTEEGGLEERGRGCRGRDELDRASRKNNEGCRTMPCRLSPTSDKLVSTACKCNAGALCEAT